MDDDSADMTTGQAGHLFQALHSDEFLRERLLSAKSMLECMEIIEVEGFACSMSELRMTLDKFIGEMDRERRNRYSLWGNVIPD